MVIKLIISVNSLVLYNSTPSSVILFLFVATIFCPESNISAPVLLVEVNFLMYA